MARHAKNELTTKKLSAADRLKQRQRDKTETTAEDIQKQTEATIPLTVDTPASGEQPEEPMKNDLEARAIAAAALVETPPAGFRPQYVEKKDKRVQFVFQKSLYERVKRAAGKRNLSMNEYVHQILNHATLGE